MKALHLSNRFWKILIYLILLLAIFLFSGHQGYAQLKESEVGLLTEAEALRLKNEGGVYAGYTDVPQYKGWWVQYRKVMRIEQVSYDPNTGQKWYHVYYSQIIPLEYNGGHDPSMIKGGWLWLPYSSAAPWKSQLAGPAFTWTLKQGYPKWNPNNQQLDIRSGGNRDIIQTALYSNGATQRLFGYDGNGLLEYDWYCMLRWSALPPNQLRPGDSFIIDLSAEAGGTLQNHHHGLSARIDHGGFHVQYYPQPTSPYNSIFAGRPGNSSQIVPKAQRRFTFTVPDNPSDEIGMTIVLGNWGGIVSFIWEKQPLY